VSPTIRPLRADEVPFVQPLAARAFDELHGRQGRPPREQGADEREAYRAMHAHLQATDPDGCLPAAAARSCSPGRPIRSAAWRYVPPSTSERVPVLGESPLNRVSLAPRGPCATLLSALPR